MSILLKGIAVSLTLITGLHAMDKPDYDPGEKPSLSNCPKDIKIAILKPVVLHFCLEEERLPVVCKDWQETFADKEIKHRVLPVLTWHSVFNHIVCISPVVQYLQDPTHNLDPSNFLEWVYFMHEPIHRWHRAMNITNGFAKPGKERGGSPGYLINLSLLCGLVDEPGRIVHAINEMASLPERPANFEEGCNEFNSALRDLFVLDGGQGMMAGCSGWNLFTRLRCMFFDIDSLIKERHGYTLEPKFFELFPEE